ncbi:hypothetical protein EJ07DRAFT_152761 [Lizonia empirigonia]|nr:hypothetical protein EJ07DRAFT_152761 [Lizonia empirigonia]
MARNRIERELRCQNSWRPSDGPLTSQARDLRQQQRSSWQSDLSTPSCKITRVPCSSSSQAPRAGYGVSKLLYVQRSSSATTHATPEPRGPQAFDNPNLIPVTHTRAQSTTIPAPEAGHPQDEQLDFERLPQIWSPSINNLIRRTAHDYDMIMNYERDAEGGQRWLPQDIAIIRDVGKHLHSDIFALRRRQRTLADQGDQDKKMMIQIKRDINLLKLQCERVQEAIHKYEQKCDFELLRDGAYAQDEYGNFYKPIAPQLFASEGGFFQDKARLSIETVEDDTWGRQYSRGQSTYYAEDQHENTLTNMNKFQIPPETHPPTRNQVFDLAFQERPLDKLEREATRQKSPRRGSTDRVLVRRVSKTHRDLNAGKATRH